jgi:hypothetical protein
MKIPRSVFCFLLVSLHTTAAQASTFPTPTCRIEVHDAHISTSLLRSRFGNFVKVNAESECDFIQRNVEITVEIWKTGTPFDHRLATFRNNKFSPSSNGYRVSMKDSFLKCLNSKATYYYGVAFASAIINGKLYKTVHVRSAHDKKLNCGT